MPLYHFKCCKCHKPARKILPASEANKTHICQCGHTLTREHRPPSTVAKEILDNGVMVKAVERPSEAEELYKTRAAEVEESRAKK